MWKPIAIISACLCTVTLCAEPELKGSPAELTAYLATLPKTVSITGESELKSAADRAIVSLKVVTENKSLQEAARANQEIRSALLRTLTERGLPADRVKASRFSSTPKYGWLREKPKSYRVENIVKITVQDEKEFQAVAKLVDSVSEVFYDTSEFEASNKDELKAKAIALTIDKAADKKRLFEEKLGVKLTPKAFSEGPAGLLPLPESAGYKRTMGYSGRGVSTPNITETAEGTEEMPAAFGELIYKATVTVEYTVETK